MKIEISSKDGKYILYTEGNGIHTVQDIKKYLTTSLQIEIDNINVYYDDLLVEDSKMISSFNSFFLKFTFETTSVNKKIIEDIILEDINLKEDNTIVEKNLRENNTNIKDINVKEKLNVHENYNIVEDSINTKKLKIKFKNSDQVIEVDQNQTFIKNNKRFFISKRKKVLNFNQIVEIIKKIKISRDDIIKMLAFTMLILTNNSEVLFILCTVFFLQMISNIFIKNHRNYSQSMDHWSRTFVMFIASMFMIDHNRF